MKLRIFQLLAAFIICNLQIIIGTMVYGQYVTSDIKLASSINFLANNNGLVSEAYSLSFVKGSDSLYGIEITNNGKMLFHQPSPVEITIRGESMSNVSMLAQGYDSIGRSDYGITAQARVRTSNGSVFDVYDLWFVISEGNFGLSRNIVVHTANGKDLGFSSAIKVQSSSNSSLIENYDITMPSMFYRNSSNIPEGAIGSDLNVPSFFIKETRMGMPYILVRDKLEGNSVLIAHYLPEVNVNGVIGGGVHGEVNEMLQYGSLGFTNNGSGLNAGFNYPCTEGPRFYWGDGWITRFHPVKNSVRHQYKVNLIPVAKMGYNETFVYTTLKSYGKGSSSLFEVDLKALYETSLDLLNTVYLETGYGSIKAAGLPFAVPLDEARRYSFYDPSMQMGFVGAQTSLAALLIQQGFRNNDLQLLERGKKMIDFWTSNTIYPTSYSLPIVWWDRFDNSVGGAPRKTGANNIYPAFLRILCDGMDGIMEADKFMRKNGQISPQVWMASVMRVAEFLRAKQESDGSLRRAYDVISGQINTDNSNNSYQGSSKLNTASVVPFFYRISDYYTSIGNSQKASEFADAAKLAADYVYNNIYVMEGKYTGGTIDQHNIIDKEAGIFAMRAFTSAYIATREPKYLVAAEHAACFVLTFIYTYDFAVNTGNAILNRYNPFKKGGVSGFSIIATGHSGADLFSSYTVYDFYKLYVLTDKQEYKDIAVFVQNNSKQAVDHDGRLGYTYRGTSPEASSLADFNFTTVDPPGIWLPWNTDACIRPMSDVNLLYGEYDIRKINLDLINQKAILYENGLGGKVTSLTGINPSSVDLSGSQANISSNPSATILNINASENSEIKILQIYQLNGTTVMDFKGHEKRQIDISMLPDGFYILNMIVNGKANNFKFLKM